MSINRDIVPFPSLMENLETPSSSVKHNTRKSFTCISLKDLWAASGHGSVAEVDSALLLLKKTGGNIDSRNTSGVTPLHIAVWRNHVPIVMRLLAAGADPDARDGESGWSSLHRALHFGHFAVASVLMQAGASLTVEDSKCRIPVDLLSGPVSQVIGSNFSAVSTEVYSWGSGTNYQLGTGNAHIQKLPGKVDALHDSYIKIIGASKFHSIAVDSNGKLYTWGFGRGGRLGHSDFDIHSGQAAVITPRLVTSGLGSHRVKAVAAAKHHTVIATESGDVFTWGSNREGQLGYTSIDTQPTPRRVSYLRIRIDAVAAANKHTAAVAESGEVFTWGCNKEGQLGYGTSNSASNYTPRMVEYLKGKAFKKVSAAKNHTVVLSADGEVFTWGHRLVNPRRVIISRSLKKCGAALLKFHRTERLHVTSVSAGMTHSSALTEDGSLFYWSSSDPDLRCEQLNSLSGKNIVSISSGKYWTATVTTTGDVYMWDGKKCTHDTPIINRLPGIKHATSVCVGETHLLAVCGLFHPAFLPALDSNHQALITKDNDDIDALDEECLSSEKQPYISETVVQSKKEVFKFVPSLKSLCEKVAAEILVEPRNAIQVLEIADSLEAENLRKHCEDIVIRNFAYIFTVSAPAICSTPLDILARLENLLDAKSSEPWSYRRLPTATATFPVIIQCEVGGIEIGNPTPRGNRKYIPKNYGDLIGDRFLLRESEANQAVSKQVRTLRKKLQQIEMLVSKQHNGHALDDQQVEKIQSKSAIEFAITELGFPLEAGPKLSFSRFSKGNGNKKAETTKKHRQTSKNKITRAEISVALISEEDIPVKSLPNEKRYISNIKENMAVELSNEDRMVGDLSFKNPKANHDSSCSRPVRSTSIKKKNKKGGLSMFLNGALDDIPKVIPSPPTPKCEGPAWGGVKIAKGPTSLRDIQNEQSKTKEAFIYPKENCEDSDDVIGVEQVRLGLYIPVAPSIPITVKPTQQVPVAEAEKSTSPWSSSRTSIYRPSLRNIQIQQGKKQQSSSHSPKSTSGFAVAPHVFPSEPGAPVPNRWFKPEAEAPSSIRSIQIEEKAMKDLRRYYSSVKLVRAQPEPL